MASVVLGNLCRVILDLSKHNCYLYVTPRRVEAHLAIRNCLKSTSTLTTLRRITSSPDQPGTWTQPDYASLTPQFQCRRMLPLTPWGTKELKDSSRSCCFALCNKYLFCSTILVSSKWTQFGGCVIMLPISFGCCLATIAELGIKLWWT